MRILYLGNDPALARRLVAFAVKHPIPLGTMQQLDVMHDDDCPRLHGGERCECEPDFQITGDAA